MTVTGASNGSGTARGEVPARPPAKVVGWSLPIQALAVVGGAWTTRIALLGLSDSERVLVVAASGMLCVLAVWGACRTFGVRCAGAALLVAVGTLGGASVFLVAGVTGNTTMALLLLPPALAWIACWPGTARDRLVRGARATAAVPLAGLALLAMFLVYTTPALVLLAAVCLALPAVMRAVRWTLRSLERVLVVGFGVFIVSGAVFVQVDHRLSFGTGVIMAELGGWLAASLALVLVTAWPQAPAGAAGELATAARREPPTSSSGEAG